MNDERLSELLPWYANGTLGADDRAWVEAQLRERPELAAELQWMQSLQSKLRESTPPVSDEVGLDRAMARIAQDRREAQVFTAPRRAPPAPAPGWGSRVRDWLDGIGMKPAMAMAVAVIAIQAGFLVQMTLAPNAPSEIRALPAGAATVPGPLLKVNFKGDATEADIRLLLVQVEGSIVGGPGQLGDYYLRVPADRIDTLAVQVRESRIVDDVTVVDALPGKE